jgi:hypothetical protein
MLGDPLTDSDSSTLDELLAVFELPDQQNPEILQQQVNEFKLRKILHSCFSRHPFHLHQFKILILHLPHHRKLFLLHHPYSLNDQYFYLNQLQHHQLITYNNK